ncbi:hypothetical protein CBR_g34999 [Chara braunii]|uniref:Uncharacterized protein n=1 Tax=Chara braunii TaxID=69332 RepID=A0A388LJZ0_CHABU|nr:hypothetical protein CBR_g34999 [Chara braunii]|eukprot:GBG82629.1 hypothetical protein CBR_g34999 [Chara braunii]
MNDMSRTCDEYGLIFVNIERSKTEGGLNLTSYPEIPFDGGKVSALRGAFLRISSVDDESRGTYRVWVVWLRDLYRSSVYDYMVLMSLGLPEDENQQGPYVAVRGGYK